MQLEIKSRFTLDVIFKAEAENIKAALQLAVKSGADLRGADLSGAALYGANLSGTNLRVATLYGTDLRGADLSGADLYGANLSGTNLRGADLSGAALRGADLSGADLSGAALYGAKEVPLLAAAQSSIVPEEGQITGWKKCQNSVLVKLLIGKNAKRSNATSRKCRAEYVKVLEVIGAEVGISKHDNKTEYRTGKIVRCDNWNEDRWVECGGGIHFFLTRIEAENY